MSGRRIQLPVAIFLIGGVLGWFLIGDWFVASLQVESPETNGYEEYVFMRNASPWAGALVGSLVSGSLMAVWWVVSHLRGRSRSADLPTDRR